MTTLADTNDLSTTQAEPPNPVTEALLSACALAWAGNPLAGLDVDRAYVERTHDNARIQHPDAELLSWRTYVSPGMWQLTWSWAQRVVRRDYPDKPGAEDLPLSHMELPDSTVLRETSLS